jgi:hypothetical protein
MQIGLVCRSGGTSTDRTGTFRQTVLDKGNAGSVPECPSTDRLRNPRTGTSEVTVRRGTEAYTASLKGG